ncbi:hypothetical protein [Halotia branconii]|uniref:Uncharacterized protein n=1 Tax=Halotia branconii CENA392 TaxID=1539056 RepID=A0AAJ6NNG1_9CYAN|nr:hypothetical protein [Halotia branconii]WGV23574.1 hypothetical protein QI031_17315 [Halotia branconii CENA392]
MSLIYFSLHSLVLLHRLTYSNDLLNLWLKQQISEPTCALAMTQIGNLAIALRKLLLL